MNPRWRSRLAVQKLNFSISFHSKKISHVRGALFRNVWASGGGAVGFSKCCSLTDCLLFELVSYPYPTEISILSSPKGVYIFFADSTELYKCLLLLSCYYFHCLATSWLSFPLTTLPAYPFLLWNSFSSHIHIATRMLIGIPCLYETSYFQIVFATIPIDLVRLSHVLPNSCLSFF